MNRKLIGYQIHDKDGEITQHESFEVLSPTSFKWELENNPELIEAIRKGEKHIQPIFKGDIEDPTIT